MATSYAAMATPGAQHSDEVTHHRVSTTHGSDGVAGGSVTVGSTEPRRASTSLSAAAFFGLRDDNSSVSGDSVDDADLESATSHVDVSMRFFCVSRDAVETYLPVVVSICVGAYFGAGFRMLLSEFADALSYEHSALLRMLGSGVFLPNAIGCFIMGVAVRCKPLLRDRFRVYFTGITTGFCGCCTTFSRLDVDVAATFVHGMWVTALLLIGVQIASAYASFRGGVHAAEAVIAYLCTRNAAFPKPPVDATRYQLDMERRIHEMEAIRTHSYTESVARRMVTTKDAFVAAHDAALELATEITRDEQLHSQTASSSHLPQQHGATATTQSWLCIAGVLLLWLWIPPFVGLGNYPSSRLFGLALAPLGALLRYYLSLFNSKPQCKDFPLYTFIANVSASVLSCLVVVIGSATSNHGSAAYRAYVFWGDGGLIVGFCGSLSTVSTWISELDTLATRDTAVAYRYAALSVLVAQLPSIFILGMYAATASAPLLV